MILFTFLKKFYPISESEYGLLTSKFISKSFKKGELIIQPGQIQRELYFVKSGVQMSYFESEHKTHVIAFTYAPGPCAIPESFNSQQPSNCYLTCLSDSEMESISYTELNEIFDQSPTIERMFRKMTETVLTGIINRHIELHSLSMEERYKVFCKRSPHLLQLVPHKHIASYLAIDATNFSKLFNNVKI